MQEQLQKCWEDLGQGVSVLVSPCHGFGEDALLLADFAAPKPKERVCDLGTGCGILPFLWCRGPAPVHVTGVDCAQEAIALAEQSAARNGLEARTSFYCADWNALPEELPRGGFDRVTCNPPYFAAGTGVKSCGSAQRTARHEPGPDMLPSLCRAAAGLLKNRGRFCLCHRPERLADVITALRMAGLEPKRLQFVQQRADTAPWLMLCEAMKGGGNGLHIEAPRVKSISAQ